MKPKALQPRFFPPTMRLEFDPDGNESRPWVTLCEHTYRDNELTLTVPKGYRSDLGSIPNALAIFFDPNGRHQRACLFHDEAYEDKIDRDLSDTILRLMLKMDGVGVVRRTVIYVGVRLFGWVRYNQGLKHPN